MKDHFRKHGVVHLVWIIIILILSIVAVVQRVDNSNQLYNYISFAAAVSSILLALVAIIYSILSGQSLAESIGSLQVSASSISNNSTLVANSASAMEEALNTVRETVGRVPISVKEMSQELTERINSIATSDASLSQIDSEGADKKIDASVGSHWSLLKTPLGVLMSLYTLELSKRYNRSFSTSDLPDSSPYTEGIVFGVCSFIAETKFCQADISRVGGNFQVNNIGNLDLSEVAPILDRQRQPIKDAKKRLEDFFADQVAAPKAETSTDDIE